METIRLPITQWKLNECCVNVQEKLVRELNMHPIIAQILTSRNITSPDEAYRFLHPSLNDLHNPFLMVDMHRGVQRVVKAIYNREKTLIYGDYDVDGVTSVSLLYKFLQHIDHPVSYYIPDRTSEGYGLSKAAIDKMLCENISLIITVDCGVSDCDQVAYARSLGIDTIILDHHEIPNTLPNAVALINPRRKECKFPFKGLAAVGIVFNFLIALRSKLRSEGYWTKRPYPNLKEYLDLVALGTIGDISPLVDENRIFVKFGLDLITEGRRVGLKALKEIAGIENHVIDSGKASFCLIPRINAAGRIASANEAVKLLLTNNLEEAREISHNLEIYNRKRQSIEKAILDEILSEVEQKVFFENVNSLVLASTKWHPGVIGIVASRLVDLYYRPAILISLKDGIGKGSGRSISDFDIYQGLKKCDSLLISYGGHRYAAGISIKEKDIEEFASLLEEVISEEIDITDLKLHTFIDAQCTLVDISYNFISQISALAPFGSGNPEPVLCARNVILTSQSLVGKNHLRMSVAGNGVVYNSIWFNKGHLLNRLPISSSLDIVFTPQINYWNGLSDIQLKMRDISCPTQI